MAGSPQVNCLTS